MARPVQVRSRDDLNKLAAELESQYTVVFSDDDHFIAMRNGRIVKRFRTMPRNAAPGWRKMVGAAELPSEGHVFLMYDELERGTRLEARLLMDGLQKGERCVYMTHLDVDVAEHTLSESGIPLGEFKKKKLIRVFKVEDPFQSGSGWPAAVGRVIEKIADEAPDRVVSWRWIRDLTDGSQSTANKTIEQHVEAAIQGEEVDEVFKPLRNFGGLFVCTYPVSGIVPKELAFDWFTNHLASHDTTILTGRNGSVLLSNGPQ